MEDALKRAVSLGLKLGATQVEAFASSTNTLHLAFEKKQVKRIEDRSDRGIGLRVLLRNGASSSMGSSFTMSPDGEAVDKAVRDALSIARTKKPEPILLSFEEETKKPTHIRLVDRKVKDADEKIAAGLASRMIRTASKDSRIRSVSGDCTFSHCETFFLNSLGVIGHYAGTLFTATTWVTARQSGSIGSASDGFASRTFQPEQALTVSRSAAETAISQLKPKPVTPGKTDIILGPEALEALSANILVFALRADFVQKKQSPLAGKVGQNVASASISLEDNPSLPGYVGSKPFDDEGHLTEKRMVMEKGRLLVYLHNHRTIAQEGSDTAGNALRVSSPDLTRKYAGEPQILPHNLIVKPGRDSLDSLVSQVKDGIYAKSVIGGHTANRVTGEFSVVPQMAYKITKGKIEHAIKDTVLSGNILDVLANIKAVGRDPVHIPSISGDSSFTAPPLLVEGLSLSG